MSFGGPFTCFSLQCRQHSSPFSLRPRERAPSTRHERRASLEQRAPQPAAPSLPRVDPRRPTRLSAVQQPPLLSTSNGLTIHIGVEYIQLLGLHVGESLSESKILTAFGRLSAEKIEEGYSARAMAGRQQLLEEAKEMALRLVGKKIPPEKNKGIELPIHLVPGALSILAGVEESDLVVQLGKKMLEARDASNMKRDILLSMALAKLGQAEHYFSVPNQVAMACTRMEEALQLLTDGGSPQLAPDLCKEIEDALETYVPQCVLNQLKLPLSTDNAKGRKGAIAILQRLLTVPKNSHVSLVGLDRHYVKQVMECLTSTEVLQVMDWTTVLSDPRCVKWYYPGLLLKGAAVHIVVGFLQRRPALVRSMDSILNLPGKDREAHVEHVICKLLLGEVENAFEILDKVEGTGKLESTRDDRGVFGEMGMHHAELNMEHAVRDHSAIGAKVLPGRNETYAFVKAHSEGTDCLPGMCLFVERWLTHAGFTQFRDTQVRRPAATLVDYFKDRKLQNSLNAGSAAHNGLFGIINLKKKEEQSTQNVPLHSPKLNGSRDPSLDGGNPLLVAMNSSMGASHVPHGYAYPGIAHVRQPRGIWMAMLGGAILGSALFAALRFPWNAKSKDFIEITTPRYAVTDVKALQAEADTVTIKPLTQRKRSRSLALPLRKADAEKLVQKWQFAKAEALGPSHDFKYMRRVLADPMLETWMTNIKEVAERGWFWKYKLDHCKVTQVDSKHLDEDGYVNVAATLKESAVMYESNGKEIDRYRSRYNVTYHVVLDGEGRWKINYVKVLPLHT